MFWDKHQKQEKTKEAEKVINGGSLNLPDVWAILTLEIIRDHCIEILK